MPNSTEREGELLSILRPNGVSIAEDAFRLVLEIARTQRTKTFELRSAVGLAHLYRANGRARAIPEVLATVLSHPHGARSARN